MPIGKLLRKKLREFLDEDANVERPETSEGGISMVAHPVEKAYLKQFSPETDVDRLERKCREYFEVIERVVGERDEWIERYRRHVRGHQVAIGMLERREARSRMAAAAVLRQLNALRAKQGMQPVVLQRADDALDSEQQSVMKTMIEQHVKLLRELDAAFDALGERSRIAGEGSTALESRVVMPEEQLGCDSDCPDCGIVACERHR